MGQRVCCLPPVSMTTLQTECVMRFVGTVNQMNDVIPHTPGVPKKHKITKSHFVLWLRRIFSLKHKILDVEMLCGVTRDWVNGWSLRCVTVYRFYGTNLKVN